MKFVERDQPLDGTSVMLTTWHEDVLNPISSGWEFLLTVPWKKFECAHVVFGQIKSQKQHSASPVTIWFILKIESKKAPRAIGPYSQAIRSGQFIFVSGQIPIDPTTGGLVDNDIQTQTHQVLKNLDAILNSAGINFGHVVRTTIFLVNLQHFNAMNEIYKTYVF